MLMISATRLVVAYKPVKPQLVFTI